MRCAVCEGEILGEGGGVFLAWMGGETVRIAYCPKHREQALRIFEAGVAS